MSETLQETVAKHTELLEEHGKVLDRHENDISGLKEQTATQGTNILNLQGSMKNLTEALNKNTEKVYKLTEKLGDQKNDIWKWVVSIVLIPIIFFLLNKYVH